MKKMFDIKNLPIYYWEVENLEKYMKNHKGEKIIDFLEKVLRGETK